MENPLFSAHSGSGFKTSTAFSSSLLSTMIFPLPMRGPLISNLAILPLRISVSSKLYFSVSLRKLSISTVIFSGIRSSFGYLSVGEKWWCIMCSASGGV